MAKQFLSTIVRDQLRALEAELKRRRLTVTTDRPSGVQVLKQMGKTARLPIQLAAKGRSVRGEFS